MTEYTSSIPTPSVSVSTQNAMTQNSSSPTTSTQSPLKTVLITGAGTGIGRATAERFLSEGWNVIAVGRRIEPLQALQLSAPTGRVLTLSCDLTSSMEVKSLLYEIEKQRQFATSLTALVNNAGLYERVAFEQSDDSHWNRIFEANLMAPMRLTRALLPFIKANRGAIINVASTLGLKPASSTLAYSAAKAALVNWTQGLALEVAPNGVRANCVCPGIVDTPIHPFHTQPPDKKARTLERLAPLQPLGRIGQPSEIAHAIWSLVAPGSEWMTGSILTIDGGISLA
jgi:NAD(P)-dependent dehydrogenase (short-subunit alcohol dehydrogenase family)